jgi:hypothetical protein
MLDRGIASPANFAILLGAFVFFPFVANWTHAFAIGSIPRWHSTTHGRLPEALPHLTVFEWAWFFIALSGIRLFGKVSFAQLTGGRWNSASAY